jgi:hypothetical protein
LRNGFDHTIQEKVVLVCVWKCHVYWTLIEILENAKLISVDAAFDISVERSVVDALRCYWLVEEQIFPGDDHEEQQKRDQQSDNELEIVIPDVVNIRSHFLPQLGPLFLIFFIEIINHVLIGIRTVEFKCRTHRRTDTIATH